MLQCPEMTRSQHTDKIQVSIVPGATFLTDNAYNPNPIEVNVGQTVLWTNDDFSFHTVTSGEVGDTNPESYFRFRVGRSNSISKHW